LGRSIPAHDGHLASVPVRLGDLDEGEGVTDLSLWTTKGTAWAINAPWVNLSGIKEKDKTLLLDALLSDVERFQEAK